MSMYDNIAYGPRTHGIRSKGKLDDIVEKSLRDAAIWDEVKDRLKKSATGYVRRTAAETVHCPGAGGTAGSVLMDEPTSALDPISTSRIEDLAVELKKNYTIVMVTHNTQQAARISDQYRIFPAWERVVEYGDTHDAVLHADLIRETEDYITGRFG